MAYRPDQLPFNEFEETVRGLKRKLDKASPHYPLVAQALDKNGQELMYQVFRGPFDRPAAKLGSVEKEWECPVTVSMQSEDKASIVFEDVLEKVTVQGEDPEQLHFIPDEEEP